MTEPNRDSWWRIALERSGLARFARAIKRRSRLPWIVGHLPESVQEWYDYLQFKKKVRTGHSLVEEDQLRPMYRKALSHLKESVGADQVGDYLEFGVYFGESLSLMFEELNRLGLDQVRLFGFDSFEGLPDEAEWDDDGTWAPGQFEASYRFAQEYLTEQGIEWDRVVLEKGWFSETLTDDFIRRHGIEKASVIMVDCDMYLSAWEALSFCEPLIRDEAIVLFDDWMPLAKRGLGEKRAFDEFLSKNPQFQAEPFGSYSCFGNPNGKVFRVRRG